MIGESRYIDFSGKYPFEVKFEELCTTINNISRGSITLKHEKRQRQEKPLYVVFILISC
ncbi:hypothetical protein Smp_014430 [Schistosoma mansoni]|uniref:hypothetical protein n=1 Tax=Schistosoma mansoni TaxID=6183 RepID=UPI0001A63CD9|nr:hypothetical protein Smp_014430 [Schistosoma mansoni]|eukprot:XP_018646024.1 hypothetical protein Smp_014430 [Schistosoma mansoni]